MPTHVVKRGECLSSIGFAYGFFWETLWNHADNAALKQERGDPFALAPGDVVQIPALRVKSIRGATGSTHRLRRKGVPAKLRVQLLDHEGTPRADLPFALHVDGDLHAEGTTDGDGWVEQWISPAATTGELVVGPEGDQQRYVLQLGHARPHDSDHGVVDRLVALGFLDADDPDADVLAGAIEDFQVAHGLEPTAELDATTTAALRDAFGG